jgi:hypothetical protein
MPEQRRPRSCGYSTGIFALPVTVWVPPAIVTTTVTV